MFLLYIVSALLFPTLNFADICPNPSVTTETYTSRNTALSLQTAYIAEFEVSCNDKTQNINLYAELEGSLVPVALIGDNKYQISWAKDHKEAATGNIKIRLFTDEGSATYRKAQRSDEDTSKIEPFTTVGISHPGAGREGLFVQTEFIAVVAALLVWWCANSMRSQIME